MKITFFVPGDPAPGGSKRAFIPKGWTRAIITDANPRAKPWMQNVKHFALEAYQGKPLLGPLLVVADFIITRPAGHFGSGKNAGTLKESAPSHPTKKPDATKLWRAAEDACTGIIWHDDAQIVEQTIRKTFGQRPGMHLEVTVLPA